MFLKCKNKSARVVAFFISVLLVNTLAGQPVQLYTPASLYNGKASINIPIYTIDLGTLKIPVALSYHSGGIHVNEVGGWCGQNTGQPPIQITATGLSRPPIPKCTR